MIKAILIINNYGKARLIKIYESVTTSQQNDILKECYLSISKRTERACNFVEGTNYWGSDTKIIYRHYATLWFVMVVDNSESYLAILDLIQVIVETLDKCFENICELDIIFHSSHVHHIIDEIVMAGMVVETNLGNILTTIKGINQYEKTQKIEVSRKKKII